MFFKNITLLNTDEQLAFLENFAVNFNEFDYGKFLRDLKTEPTIVSSVEKQGLVDEKGLAINK